MLRAVFSFFICFVLFFSCAMAQTISGNVRQDEIAKAKNKIVDSQTQNPITGAAVSIPSLGFRTTTANDGSFELNANVDQKAIMSVHKEGYRPFSLTIDKEIASRPLKLGIEKSQDGDITIESDLCHLGDDVYSETSANSQEFKGKSVGAFYSKKFNSATLRPNEEAVLIIGSIIGLDTKLAKELGQNKIASVYSSPAEVYFNGQKIAELNVNGDNQEILIPRQLVRGVNEFVLKTGRNLFQHAYIDYDDIEIANVRYEIRHKEVFANK